MTRYLLDTNHASAILRGDSTLHTRMEAVDEGEFGLSLPSVGELWFMVVNSTQQRSNIAELNALIDRFSVWDYSMECAMEFGRRRAELHAIGRPVPVIDVQIAACARVNGLVVLTADKHFSYISGIHTQNWLSVPGC